MPCATVKTFMSLNQADMCRNMLAYCLSECNRVDSCRMCQLHVVYSENPALHPRIHSTIFVKQQSFWVCMCTLGGKRLDSDECSKASEMSYDIGSQLLKKDDPGQ